MSDDEDLAQATIRDWRTARLSPADRALCAFAEKLTAAPARMVAEDVEELRRHGFTDQAIHDATQVIAYFNYINRIADALGTDLEPEMPPRPKSWHPVPIPVTLTASPAVTLEPITKESLDAVLRLRPAPYQERFVASVERSLAQAPFYEGLTSRAIAADGQPVGFVLTQEQPSSESVYIVRFLLDERFQSRGFGRRAMALVVEQARALPWVRRITLTYVPTDGSAEGFYRKLGFTHTGRADEDGELEMELVLRPG